MSEAEFERERAQLFQKLGLRYDPEMLNNSDNVLSTQQVKTALKRRTTAPPAVSAPLLQLPADASAQSQALARKVSAPADASKSQIPTPAVREQPSLIPDRRPTSPSHGSNPGHPAGSATRVTSCDPERDEKSVNVPEPNNRASSPNGKLSSASNAHDVESVANPSLPSAPHESKHSTEKDGHKPSLLMTPKVKSLKPPPPPPSSVEPSPSLTPSNKTVSASALPASKLPTGAQLVRKASLPEQSIPEQGIRTDEGKRPLPSGIKPPTKLTDVGAKKNESAQTPVGEKIPIRRNSAGNKATPSSSEHSSGGLLPSQSKPSVNNLVNPSNDLINTPDRKKGKDTSISPVSNGHSIPSSTEGANFGNCTCCGLAVLGGNQGCVALERLYHTVCFTCSKCGRGLHDKTFYVTSRNEVLCEKDYFSNLPKCHKCQLYIENQMVHASGATYHPDCFRCVECGKEMEKVPYAVDEMHQIYCERDYHLKFSPKCYICCDPITPQLGKAKSMRVKAMGKYFHLECYKCEDCDVELAKVGSTEKKCYPIEEHLFCKQCSKRRTQRESPPQRDTATPSPIPRVKITPSPSPSPIPPPFIGESAH